MALTYTMTPLQPSLGAEGSGKLRVSNPAQLEQRATLEAVYSRRMFVKGVYARRIAAAQALSEAVHGLSNVAFCGCCALRIENRRLSGLMMTKHEIRASDSCMALYPSGKLNSITSSTAAATPRSVIHLPAWHRSRRTFARCTTFPTEHRVLRHARQIKSEPPPVVACLLHRTIFVVTVHPLVLVRWAHLQPSPVI